MHGPKIGTPVLTTPSSPLNGITVLIDSQRLLVHILKKDYNRPSTLIRYRPPTLPHRAAAACCFRWEVGQGEVLREEAIDTLKYFTLVVKLTILLFESGKAGMGLCLGLGGNA